MINKNNKKFIFLKNFKKVTLKTKNLRNFLIFSEMYYKLKKSSFLLINKYRLKTYYNFKKKYSYLKLRLKNKVNNMKKKKLKKFFYKYNETVKKRNKFKKKETK